MNPNQIQGEKSIVEKPIEACPPGSGRGGGGKSRYTVWKRVFRRNTAFGRNTAWASILGWWSTVFNNLLAKGIPASTCIHWKNIHPSRQVTRNWCVTAKTSVSSAFKISCDQTLSLDKFDGRTGQVRNPSKLTHLAYFNVLKIFRVTCPPGCCASTTPVYGLRVCLVTIRLFNSSACLLRSTLLRVQFVVRRCIKEVSSITNCHF